MTAPSIKCNSGEGKISRIRVSSGVSKMGTFTQLSNCFPSFFLASKRPEFVTFLCFFSVHRVQIVAIEGDLRSFQICSYSFYHSLCQYINIFFIIILCTKSYNQKEYCFRSISTQFLLQRFVLINKSARKFISTMLIF